MTTKKKEQAKCFRLAIESNILFDEHSYVIQQYKGEVLGWRSISWLPTPETDKALQALRKKVAALNKANSTTIVKVID